MPDIERLGALFLANIGLKSSDLVGVRHVQTRQLGEKLLLRTDGISLVVAMGPTPISAEHFNKAIPPYGSGAHQTALLSVIKHHEAHLTLTLKINRPIMAKAGQVLLHRAVQSIEREVNALGLLWGPTRRLWHKSELRPVLAADQPLELFLAPHFKTKGGRKSRLLEFINAPEILGHGLSLQYLGGAQQAAVAAGLAFARQYQTDTDMRGASTYAHDGATYRLLASQNSSRALGRDIAMFQVAQLGIPQVSKNIDIKTAA